jgi:hypothetical protein
MVLAQYAAAMTAAALTPIMVLAALGTDMSDLELFYLPAALLHVVVIGLPVAILFRRRGWDRFVPALLAGFLAGAVPVGLWMATRSASMPAAEGLFPGAYEELVLSSWRLALVSAGYFGLLGMVGGLAAWLVWRASRSAPLPWFAAGTSALVLALVAPSLVRAYACPDQPLENASRGVVLHAQIRLPASDWAAVQPMTSAAFKELRSESHVAMATKGALQCPGEIGTPLLTVSQIVSEGQAYPVSVGVSVPEPGTRSEAAIQDFLRAVEARWPGRLEFTDRNGAAVAPPAFLSRDATP